MRTRNKILLPVIAALATGMAFIGCDKVSNPYPAQEVILLDTTLYGGPGNWSDYVFPVFSANSNTQVNVLLEDFTGHTCFNCPTAAEIAHTIQHDNPGRVFVASIHTGPTGMGAFQTVSLPDYPTDWTNPEGLAIGTFLGSRPNSAFQGNPRGAVNRVLVNNQLTLAMGSWATRANAIMAANNLRVNIQSKANYFESTRGIFLHTEVDPVASYGDGQLAVVTYIIEDSIVGDQKMTDNSHNSEYVHRDVMRGCIDGLAFGKTLGAADKQQSGNYYLSYSYKVPEQYNPDNMHFLIYVYDKTSNEILQVIEQRFVE